MHLAAAFLACLLCTAAAAQGMYKCKDAAGKITYSGNECHLVGLTSAGDVAGRASVAPAFKPAPNRPAPPAVAATPAASEAEDAPKPPAAPQRRCFTVKTAKGTATRCNDTPAEDSASK